MVVGVILCSADSSASSLTQGSLTHPRRPWTHSHVIYFAAMAIESGSEWVTADRDFGRFPGLKWQLIDLRD